MVCWGPKAESHKGSVHGASGSGFIGVLRVCLGFKGFRGLGFRGLGTLGFRISRPRDLRAFIQHAAV